MRLYSFDRRFRLHVFDAIERFEVAFRAALKALFMRVFVGVGSEDFEVGDDVDDSGEFVEGFAVAV